MNILFLASTLPRFLGDSQPDFVLQQAKAWKKCRPFDTIKILAPHDEEANKSENIDGIEIERFAYFWPKKAQKLAYPAILPNIKRNPLLLFQVPFFLMAEFWHARKLSKNINADLVYAHWVMPQGIIAYFLKKLTGQRYVLHNHSSDITAFSILGLLGRWFATRIICQSDKLFCVNTLQAEAVGKLIESSSLSAHHKSKTRDKVVVLPMGVQSPPQDHLLQEKEKTQHHKYKFGSISRLTSKKGLNYFLEAGKKLDSPRSDLRVALAGDGEEQENLNALADGLDVSFPGYLSGAEKERLFNDCEYMVFSSVATGGDVEGLPVAMMEALVRGKIIIASRDTNITTLPEWLLIREDIFFLEDPTDLSAFSDTLNTMLKLDANDKATRSERLKHHMKRYMWGNLIQEYVQKLSQQ